MQNIPITLPEDIYLQLQEEAERTRQTADALATEAVNHWLRKTKKIVRQKAIAKYAAKNAGTAIDLDRELESSSIEHLLETFAQECE